MRLDLRFTEFPYIMWGLRNFLDEIEKSLNYYQRQYPDRIRKELNKKGYKDGDPDFEIEFQDINEMVDRILPRTFRNSFIVFIWGAFETLIRKSDNKPELSTEAIVNYISKRNEMKLKFSDFNGSFIDKTKKYLIYVNEVTGVDLNLSQEEWKKIEILYTLRNAIAHGGGILDNLKPDNKNKILEYGKQQYIKFSIIWGEIILERESLEESYKLVNDIGSELIEKVKSSF